MMRILIWLCTIRIISLIIIKREMSKMEYIWLAYNFKAVMGYLLQQFMSVWNDLF